MLAKNTTSVLTPSLPLELLMPDSKRSKSEAGWNWELTLQSSENQQNQQIHPTQIEEPYSKALPYILLNLSEPSGLIKTWR